MKPYIAVTLPYSHFIRINQAIPEYSSTKRKTVEHITELHKLQGENGFLHPSSPLCTRVKSLVQTGFGDASKALGEGLLHRSVFCNLLKAKRFNAGKRTCPRGDPEGGEKATEQFLSRDGGFGNVKNFTLRLATGRARVYIVALISYCILVAVCSGQGIRTFTRTGSPDNDVDFLAFNKISIRIQEVYAQTESLASVRISFGPFPRHEG